MRDILVPLTSGEHVAYKPSKASVALRAVIITRNAKKFEEIRLQLGDGYGMRVTQFVPDLSIDLEDQTIYDALCVDVVAMQPESPHFILREKTSLICRANDENITDLLLQELAKKKLESVLHISSLLVYKPQWSEVPDSNDIKKLTAFTRRCYTKNILGYITNKEISIQSKHGFGWDAIFINATTNLSNDEFYTRYGKKSARQHVISDFIETYLRYKTLKALAHHHISISKPINFGKDYISMRHFVESETHLSNPFISVWGIDKLRNTMINQGLFFKASWSRPVKNYFSPPFSGIPLTAKKDAAEETIFMTHDILHHLIPDLICDTPPSREHFYVYCIWRMMSEACTLVLADMLYADSLIQLGVECSCVDKRIYPLFEAIKEAQNIDASILSVQQKAYFIRDLLYANVVYALLGSDYEWRKLLSTDEVITPEHQQCLNRYKDHFGKFFIGDLAWTKANYENMQKSKQPLDQWIAGIGRNNFRAANVPLLSDIYNILKNQSICLDDYKALVSPMFDYLFHNRIEPVLLSADTVTFDHDDLVQSRAFRRYLIGQASIFFRYPIPLNLESLQTTIFERLQDQSPFSDEEQFRLRMHLKQYILGLEGLGLMSREEALNAIDCFPIFAPVYISYPKMQEIYQTIQNAVSKCILSYGESLYQASEQGQRKNVVSLFRQRDMATSDVGTKLSYV